MKVRRPILRYHGGKWKLAKWIISHFPAHRIYVEPFGGAGSVLLQKARVHAEVYNDLDGEIVNLFRVLRNPSQARELIRILRLTPYARAEFELSYITDGDPIEQARRTVIRSFMGFGSTMTGRWKTGFRSNSSRSGTTPARDWMNYPDGALAFVERLRGVVIENKPAVKLVADHDGPRTLFYCDPPYVQGTRYIRWAGEAYRHDMSDDEHRQLAEVLGAAQGYVIISGYACDLYNQLYPDWQTVTRETYADGAQKRIESLWLSPRTAEALNGGSVPGGLFEWAANGT